MEYRIIEHPRPYFDQRVQARIDQICGTNERGESLVRLEWGGWEKRFLAGKWRPKYQRYAQKPRKMLVGWVEQSALGALVKVYPASRIAPVPQEPTHLILPIAEEHDECDPFWYLAEWVPPEKLGETPESWEAKRRLYMAQNKGLDMIGPFPDKGRYAPVMRLADEKDGFLSADDGRILNLVEGFRRVQAECDTRKAHWREYLSQAELEQIAREALYAHEKQAEMAQAEFRDALKSDLMPSMNRLLNNPRVIYDSSKIKE